MKEYKLGDTVTIGGYSGFCAPDSLETVAGIDYRYDEITGERYQIICTEGARRWFRSDTGQCVRGLGTAYRIKEDV